MMDKFVQQYSRTPVLDGFAESQQDIENELKQLQGYSSSSSSVSVPHFELPKVENVRMRIQLAQSR